MKIKLFVEANVTKKYESNRDVLDVIMKEQGMLAVLQTLSSAPGYSSNLVILQEVLSEFGLLFSQEIFTNMLLELKDSKLLELLSSHTLVPVRLTNDGREVAMGLKHVEGVARPLPHGPYNLNN